jgi:hypothetical protein
MPLYPCKCECGHYEEVFRTVANAKDLPKHCGKPMQRVFTPHMVITDMQPYKSPLDGTWITTRTKHRSHMKEHGVIEVGNEKLTRPASKPYDPGNLKQDIANSINELEKKA